MDTAGKDGAIRHVMSGVSPQGCQVFSFQHPSAGSGMRACGPTVKAWLQQAPKNRPGTLCRPTTRTMRG
ncbi:hypothetical protein [Rhodoferax sp.]|uniref:hypothetical protein n=1 Tax=Rhodoferax sp. TaxID=50421 RepID=UPI0025DAAE2B|nr:hypothetical protein [Rhodoferax sp.]